MEFAMDEKKEREITVYPLLIPKIDREKTAIMYEHLKTWTLKTFEHTNLEKIFTPEKTLFKTYTQWLNASLRELANWFKHDANDIKVWKIAFDKGLSLATNPSLLSEKLEPWEQKETKWAMLISFLVNFLIAAAILEKENDSDTLVPFVILFVANQFDGLPLSIGVKTGACFLYGIITVIAFFCPNPLYCNAFGLAFASWVAQHVYNLAYDMIEKRKKKVSILDIHSQVMVPSRIFAGALQVQTLEALLLNFHCLSKCIVPIVVGYAVENESKTASDPPAILEVKPDRSTPSQLWTVEDGIRWLKEQTRKDSEIARRPSMNGTGELRNDIEMASLDRRKILQSNDPVKKTSRFSTPIALWETEDVLSWLAENELGIYIPGFKILEVNGARLIALTSKLEDIGGTTSLLDRQKIIKLVSKFTPTPIMKTDDVIDSFNGLNPIVNNSGTVTKPLLPPLPLSDDSYSTTPPNIGFLSQFKSNHKKTNFDSIDSSYFGEPFDTVKHYGATPETFNDRRWRRVKKPHRRLKKKWQKKEQLSDVPSPPSKTSDEDSTESV